MLSITSNTIQIFKKNFSVFKKFLPILPFIVSFLVLYSLYPESFEATWKGRTFYLLFLWLVSIEMVFDCKLGTDKMNKPGSIRTVAFITTLLLPMIYVVVANYCGLNDIIADLAEKNNVYWAEWMSLSTEYLIFAVFLGLIVLAYGGINGLMDFSVSVFFLGAIGVIYTIDNLYPYGRFTPFQIFVPTTAMLAANVLNFMGYQTRFLSPVEDAPFLVVWNSTGSAGFGIAWPCSGVESLLIYAVTILLFLKKTAVPWSQRMIYFLIGAIATYSINVLRIVTFFVVAINEGNYMRFHEYYGQLYSITWIVSYILIIIGSRSLWRKITCCKNSTQDDSDNFRVLPA